MIHFTKTLERDGTLFVQGLWARGLNEDLEQRYGILLAERPSVVNYGTSTNLQLWENDKAVTSYVDGLLAKNQEGIAFIEKVIADYRELMAETNALRAKGPLTEESDLTRYIELVRLASLSVSLTFYAGNDDRTPAEVRDMVMKFREHDEFFPESDIYTRACIAALKPDIAEFASLVLPDEILDLPDRTVFEVRAKGIVQIDGRDYEHITLSDFVAAHAHEYTFDLPAALDTTTEIKGQIGFKGKVRGTVRIVKNVREMEQVKEGDILVSPMTTPDFLPAMKMAGAFVTDEGGIMCHAAIVSREMKKPCIIGTKNATQILKDGDLVEVDAEKGVVIKLDN